MAMTCTPIGADSYICREETREVRREQDGEIRWCFHCRKVRTFEFVVSAPTGPSYYGPNAAVQCATCHTTDGDLFPGRCREWEG